MAFNPPLVKEGGIPIPVPGEVFLLHRTGISLKLSFRDGRKDITLKGEIHVTSIRIVFVATPKVKGLYSFDIPMNNISKERFNQPIFGANYVSGEVAPIPGFGIEGQVSFQIIFKSGGCGTFIQFFFRLMEEVHKSRTAVSDFNRDLAAGTLMQSAFIDPSDPSVIYISQPTHAEPKKDSSIPMAIPVAYPIPGYAAPVNAPNYAPIDIEM